MCMLHLLCKLMRIRVSIFSQHGNRARKEFETTRVKVLPSGQFRQPIQQPCHTPVALHSSRSLMEATTTVRTPCRQHLFPATSIPTDKQTNRSVSLPSDGSLAESRKTLLHAPTRTDLQSGAKIQAPAPQALFGHTPSLAVSSTANEPIQPLQVSRRRRKSPPFPPFLSDDYFLAMLLPQSPFFLCFLKLYYTFRTLGVVSVDLLLISHLYG